MKLGLRKGDHLKADGIGYEVADITYTMRDGNERMPVTRTMSWDELCAFVGDAECVSTRRAPGYKVYRVRKPSQCR